MAASIRPVAVTCTGCAIALFLRAGVTLSAQASGGKSLRARGTIINIINYSIRE